MFIWLFNALDYYGLPQISWIMYRECCFHLWRSIKDVTSYILNWEKCCAWLKLSTQYFSTLTLITYYLYDVRILICSLKKKNDFQNATSSHLLVSLDGYYIESQCLKMPPTSAKKHWILEGYAALFFKKLPQHHFACSLKYELNVNLARPSMKVRPNLIGK